MGIEFICGECRYFGFKGLEWYCRHPAHVRPVKAARSCPDYLDRMTKALPGTADPHPAPVDINSKQEMTHAG